MTSPALMVLYSNDAVEVRYSDQSCLQVAPCGSTFVHHESPKEVLHPAHGMKTISQRSEFVTSDYRHKLIQALDFRNRFAERPFLCNELILPDQIVPLYANIKEAAWPKSVEDCEIDYLPDGSVRLLSADEYASIVLSPHKQDFTVCYLSQISSEPPKPKRYRHQKTNHKTKSSDKPSESRKETLDATLRGSSFHKDEELNIHSSSHHGSHPGQGFEEGGLDVDESLSKPARSELNISPISMASSLRSPHTSPESQQECNKFHRYSTPTNRSPDGNADDGIEIGGKKSAFKHYRHSQNQGSDGSFLEVIESQKTSTTSVNQQNTKPGINANDSLKGSSGQVVHSDSSYRISTSTQQLNKSPQRDVLPGTPAASPSKDSAHSSFNSQQSEQDSVEGASPRCLYTWVTRHFSCDECPVAWRHPLNMARSMINQREEQEKKMLDGCVTKKKDPTLQKFSKDQYCMCPLPTPLPLTCPAQHLHKLQSSYIYDDEKNSLDNLTTFKQGRLKVLMVEGVIFRILQLSSTRVLEIYPGDGSVIVSQGVKGLYYKHLSPYGDRSEVEERSYSIKALPPPTPGTLYSVEKLIKRAYRFYNQANQEDKILTKADVCCWKQQSLVIDLLPTSVLEECTIPDYGRFTAFSSGHVRIVFNDRTSLDMWCDFSKRLECCLQHSEGIHSQQCQSNGEGGMPTALKVNADLREGFCKLLLPNGQYQVVDVKKPGLYRKYTDAAIEWSLWVNSLPSQRKEFYTKWQQQQSDEQMVHRELQKIKCFNYIVDHTTPRGDGGNEHNTRSKGGMKQAAGSMDQMRGQEQHETYLSASQTLSLQQNTHSRSQLHVHFSPPSASNSSYPFRTQESSHMSHSSYPIRTQDNSHMSVQSQHSSISRSQSGPFSSNFEMMQGFDSVREALLKTSKVIHDIDDILDKRKT